MVSRHKLLARAVLKEAYEQRKLGVSINRIRSNLKLSLSKSAMFNLLTLYEITLHNEQLAKQLFPPWLNDNLPDVQSPPGDWIYEGRLPYGKGWFKQTGDTLKLHNRSLI